MESTNIRQNTMKLPFMICSVAACMIRYGEKYHIVIGNNRKERSRHILRILCLMNNHSCLSSNADHIYIVLIYRFDTLCPSMRILSRCFFGQNDGCMIGNLVSDRFHLMKYINRVARLTGDKKLINETRDFFIFLYTALKQTDI